MNLTAVRKWGVMSSVSESSMRMLQYSKSAGKWFGTCEDTFTICKRGERADLQRNAGQNTDTVAEALTTTGHTNSNFKLDVRV